MIKKPKPVAARTQLMVCNGSKSPVTVFIVLGATKGCLQDVSQIPWGVSGKGLVGSFVLAPGASTLAWAPAKLGFNGNFAFNAMPSNCPTTASPNGVSLFEFIVNNGFQAGNPQETVDISCVDGINSIIKASLSGPAWNAGPTQPNVKLIQNDVYGKNTGQVGVFPYGCDNCTKITAPPKCSKKSFPAYEKPQAAAICNVQRSAKAVCGGLVTVTYLGPTGVKKAGAK